MFPLRPAAAKLILVVAVIGVVVALVIAAFGRRDATGLLPVTHNGAKWRIAYYEGGPYQDYVQHLRAVVYGLAELGWMQPITVPEYEDLEDARAIWAYLAQHARSDYITFLPDAYWSADWDDSQRRANREAATARLAGARDIDLVIAVGTWAGLDLATDAHTTPTVVVGASDAVEAGIIPSAQDSGRDHVHAWCDPATYRRQVRLFHDIVGFTRLGVAYGDTPDDRTYANLGDLEEVGQERGFAVVKCTAPDSNVTELDAFYSVYGCFEKLAPQVDAVWLHAHRGTQSKFMPQVLKPLFEYNIPTWSQVGGDEVRRGVLISTARQNLEGLGLWTAEVIAQIFHGVKPRDIGQIYEVPGAIAINLETARRIGFVFPESVVSIADETYTEIENESR